MLALETKDESIEEMFQVDSDARANGLLRKLANIEAEKARVTAQAAPSSRRWTPMPNGSHTCSERSWNTTTGRRLHRGEGSRFLQGTRSLRTVPAGLRISDQSAALHFAQGAGLGVVRHVATLDAAGYRDLAEKHLQETG